MCAPRDRACSGCWLITTVADSTPSFQVYLVGPTDAPVELKWRAIQGSAKEGQHYRALAPSKLTFEPRPNVSMTDETFQEIWCVAPRLLRQRRHLFVVAAMALHQSHLVLGLYLRGACAHGYHRRPPSIWSLVAALAEPCDR